MRRSNSRKNPTWTLVVTCSIVVLVAQLVLRRSWRRWQTAGGGSIPRWSASKTRDRRPAERQRARTKKKVVTCSMANHKNKKHKQSPTKGDTQIPSQICAFRHPPDSNANSGKGQGQQKHPQKRFAKNTVGKSQCVAQKHATTELVATQQGETRYLSYCQYHIVIMTDVATALIRWICTMQLSFRLDKRPGREPSGVGRKKNIEVVAKADNKRLHLLYTTASPSLSESSHKFLFKCPPSRQRVGIISCKWEQKEWNVGG